MPTNMGVASFEVKRGHRDFQVAYNQCFQSRRLGNTVNKVLTEKSLKYKDETVQTPVMNELGLDDKAKLSQICKAVAQKLKIILPAKVRQTVSMDRQYAWNAVIAKRKKGMIAGNPKPTRGKLAKVRYTKQAISQKKGLHRLIPTGWKEGVGLPKWLPLSSVQSVELIPNPYSFTLKVLYHKDETQSLPEPGTKIAGLDFGLENLITLVIEDSDSKVICGTKAKTANQYANKFGGKLSSLEKWRQKRQLFFVRDKQFYHFTQTLSNRVVSYLLDAGVGVLVVGWNPGFKSEPKLGRKTNARFAVMPLAKIRDAISRKCEEAGIKVILTEESYTSKASFLDRDLMPVYGEETGVSFSGKRTKRGVYVSNNGTEIHADVNGAANIIRKVFSELDFQVQLIPSGMKLPSESFPQKRKPSYWRSREGISSSLERAA